MLVHCSRSRINLENESSLGNSGFARGQKRDLITTCTRRGLANPDQKDRFYTLARGHGEDRGALAPGLPGRREAVREHLQDLPLAALDAVDLCFF